MKFTQFKCYIIIKQKRFQSILMKKEILSWLVEEHVEVTYGKLYSVLLPD